MDCDVAAVVAVGTCTSVHIRMLGSAKYTVQLEVLVMLVVGFASTHTQNADAHIIPGNKEEAARLGRMIRHYELGEWKVTETKLRRANERCARNPVQLAGDDYDPRAVKDQMVRGRPPPPRG